MLDIENLQPTTNLTFPSLEDMLAQAITAIDLSDCAWSCESYCHQWISETCPDACFTSQGNPNSNYYLQMAECNPDRCLSGVTWVLCSISFRRSGILLSDRLCATRYRRQPILCLSIPQWPDQRQRSGVRPQSPLVPDRSKYRNFTFRQ